eukprot:SAG22_NODE_1850_length_3446_cov_2.774425_3_plen_142_part_00
MSARLPVRACLPAAIDIVRRFHGGCFTGGSPEGADGSSLIEESGGDVIVVTVAFRLGVFGHLASDGLKARSMHGGPPGNVPGSAGNWGIQDQRESLRWVKRNIAAFGEPPGGPPYSSADNLLIKPPLLALSLSRSGASSEQ